MSYMTYDEYCIAINGYDFLQKKAEALVEDYEAKFLPGEYVEEGSVSVCGDEITGDIDFTTWDAYGCSCCPRDSYYHEIPISYLWDEDWVEKEEKKREEQRRIHQENEAKRKKEEEEKLKKQRYEQYLRMKEEFEPGKAKSDELTKLLEEDENEN